MTRNNLQKKPVILISCLSWQLLYRQEEFKQKEEEAEIRIRGYYDFRDLEGVGKSNI